MKVRLHVGFLLCIGVAVSYLLGSAEIQETKDRLFSNMKKSDRSQMANGGKELSFPLFLSHHHPECVNEPARTIELSTFGKYIYKPGPPVYDHNSCYVMKARYNCAYNPNTTKEQDRSHNYRVVWHQHNQSSFCDFRAVLEEYTEATGASSVIQLLPQGTRILIQGNSFMRQLWESTVCMFDSQLQGITVQLDGPPISKAASKSRNLPILISDLGLFIDDLNTVRIDGCHGQDEGNIFTRAYSKEGIAPLSTIANRNCTDDIAVATFENVKIGYWFRRRQYDKEAAAHIFNNILQLQGEIDYFLFNDGESSPGSNVKKAIIMFAHVLDILKKLQAKSIGTYFGANNPGIYRPPDTHPCMPGIPDDEAYLMMFAILSGYRIV